MEEQKILFADLYRLMGCIKGETKDAGKAIDRLLGGFADWESLSMAVNGIVSEAQLIASMAQAMIDNADLFLRNGPYEGECAHTLPLESYARGAEKRA